MFKPNEKLKPNFPVSWTPAKAAEFAAQVEAEKIKPLKILVARQQEAEEALLKLVKKGKKYNVVPVTWAWGNVFSEAKQVGENSLGQPIYRNIPYIPLFVSGEPPRVAGYDFIARIEFAEGGALVQTVPGQTVPKEYWATDGHCDHCKTKRYRKDVFIVRNSEGGHMQVGRSCLQEFLGNDPAQILRHFGWLSSVSELEDTERGDYGNLFIEDPQYFLTNVATAIRVLGWVSKGMAAQAEERGQSLTPTVTVVRMEHGNAKYDVPYFKEKIEANRNEADAKLAAETIEWVRALDNPGNEYLNNLKVIFSAEYIYQPKHLGLAASAVSAFLREKARQDELNIKKGEAKLSQYVGKVGERLRNIKVQLKQVIGLPDNGFGPSSIYKFVDENKNRYTWFSGVRLYMEIDGWAVMTATVKEHTEYNGIMETKLTRAKVDAIEVVKT